MAKIESKSIKYFFIFLLNVLMLTKQDNSFYTFPIEIFSQNYLPMIPIFFKELSYNPKLLLLDINSEKSWIFQSEDSDNNEDKTEIMKHDFYSIIGKKNIETIYLNSDVEIKNFNHLVINQINTPYIYPGVLSLNKKMNEYNIANKLEYEDNQNINDKYFGFCIDFYNIKKNEVKLSIGNMFNLNNDISKLIRLPLYKDDDEDNYSKWSIKLKGLFIGTIDTTLTENKYIENKNKDMQTAYVINRKYNKGLIIDEAANVETIYNSIYITKEAMLFLEANYFKKYKNFCFRQENFDSNNYEIKYNCYKKKKDKLDNINLILDNFVTIQLTHDDLLNCAINKNLNLNEGNSEMCEFNVRYHEKIEHYILGLPVLKKFKTYFLFNNNSILLEGENFLNCYLKEEKFSNISRQKKRNIWQTIKELFNTTLCISFIFALLAGSFYLYDKYNEKSKEEKIINRDKYAYL